jgi:hypothetical protein
MRNCASGNLEIPGSMLLHRPGMTKSELLRRFAPRHDEKKKARHCAPFE